MTAAHRLVATRLSTAAAFAATALILVTGCAATGNDGPAAPASPPATADSADDPAGTQESGTPEEQLTPEQENARSIVGVFAADAAEWFDAWTAAACTGDRAAEDVRDCQNLLMELATTIEAQADMLSAQVAVYEPLREPAAAAHHTAEAATDWLGAWCGAYADAACAAPGNALVEAYAAFEIAVSPWHPRTTPDA